MDPLDTRIQIIPHPIMDPHSFASLPTLAMIVKKNGYGGATVLFMAILRLFHEYCVNTGLKLRDRGFKLGYQTNIPRFDYKKMVLA